MSIAICRVEKVKGASGVAGLQIHNRRERANSNSNPDIDHSRSHLNYTLVGTSDKTFNVLADERIKQGYTGTKTIRKDAVRMITSIFTSNYSFFVDKSLEQQRQFFEDCLEWTQKRFGAENIISAIVHMDEETPHLHVEFVPLTVDGRLTAKEVLGVRSDFQDLQDDFHRTVGEVWGMKRGERADLDNLEIRPRKHKTTAQLKRETESEVAALEAERDKLALDNADSLFKRSEMQRGINTLREKEKALESKIKSLETRIKSLGAEYADKKPKAEMLKRIKIKDATVWLGSKTLNGEHVKLSNISVKDAESIIKMASAFLSQLNEEKEIKQVKSDTSSKSNAKKEGKSLIGELEKNKKIVKNQKSREIKKQKRVERE